jgi:multicomponent K+:H+ antiporter subunit D
MSHLVIAPILIPAIIAPLIVLWMRHDMTLQRVFGFLGVGLQLAVAMLLVARAAGGETQVYALGDWPAPFGIVLVLDRLSALMALVTAGLSLGALFYAVAGGWDARGRHFHALFQFQLMGIMGAFLTGDLFNLFVFFEILLIASYGLMLHGGGPRAMRAGVQYVAVNLLGSTLFLFAVGAIYAATGTLNMADLGARAGAVSAEDAGLLRVGGLVLLAVFGVKAALVPLHFWLPITYGATPAPVAALFAVMTKVGAYSILRVYTLIFGEGAGEAAWLAADWLMPAALVTLVVGALGVLGARSLSAMVSFSVIASMGTLLTAVGAFTPASSAAALYYMIHSTFAGGALFLLLEQVAARRRAGDALTAAPPFPRAELVGGLFMLGAIAMAGMPPLSGFLGKLMVLDGLRGGDWAWTAWTVVLTTSLMLVVGFARAGSALFWGGAPEPDADRPSPAPAPGDRATPLIAPAYLLAVLVGLTALANPVTAYLEATAAQLYAAPGAAASALAAAGG